MVATRFAKRVAVMICVAVIASFAFAGTALAEVSVHGADFQGGGTTIDSGNIDVLHVDGEVGDTIFITMTANGRTIADAYPYKIEQKADGGNATEYAGVVTLDIEGLNTKSLSGVYTIKAYKDRNKTTELYSGEIYGVYADIPGESESRLIGTRTANDAELASRTFDAPETLFVGGRPHKLVGEAERNGNELHFKYEPYDESTTVDGSIRYVNEAGDVIATKKVPGLEMNAPAQEVEIPQIVTADNGDVYRTVSFYKDNKVALQNPGKTSYSVYCTQMSQAAQMKNGYYLATIQMVDENGGVIATDSVNVTGKFLYTAPSVIYKTVVVDGVPTVITYDIKNKDATLLTLDAADNVNGDLEITIPVEYVAQPLDGSKATVTFNLIDGSKRVKEEGRSLGTKQVTLDGETFTAMPESTITVDGAKYFLVGDPSDYAYERGSRKVPTIDVYYTPEGYTAPGPYNVTVNYVNFVTGDVLESHSYPTDEGPNAKLSIETPAEFSIDGNTYVRLNGQEDAINHSYYSGIASYTVYYRDINDELSANVVINTIRVAYGNEAAAPGETVTTTTEGGTDEGGTTVAADTAAATTPAQIAEAMGAQLMQLNTERTYNVMDGAAGNTTLTNESGVDSNTERIADEETPLASGFDRGGASSAASSFSAMSGILLPLGIAAAIAVLAIVAVVFVRRRAKDDRYDY